jgi:hypothetical protein
MRVISSIPPEISSDNQEDLTILLKPPKPTITQEGNKLTANYSIGYQWYLNGDALYLANSRTHTAKKDGYYKVKVIEQGCFSDFSDSIYINVTSVSNEIYDSFSIFPNPASNYITLQANGRLPQKEIQIFNIFGERVLFTPSSLRDDTPQEGNFKINVSSLPPGIYFIRIGVEKPLKFLKI